MRLPAEGDDSANPGAPSVLDSPCQAGNRGEDTVANEDESRPALRQVVWGGSQPPYISCSHRNCSKKADPRVTSHDCCDKPKHRHLHPYGG